MNFYGRIVLGIMISCTMILLGMMIAEVGLNAGSLIVIPILFSMAMAPYLYPELLINHRYADQKFGRYIYAVRSVKQREKSNSEF